MPHNSPLVFRVAKRRDFVIPFIFLFVLAMLSAILSNYFIPLSLLVIPVFGAVWFKYTLDLCKVNVVELISIIFPDGRVTLKPGQHPEIEGYLDGQQWCTRHVVVLKYKTGCRHQYMVLLSAQQNAEDFRRLNVWLRQDFCTDTSDAPVSGI